MRIGTMAENISIGKHFIEQVHLHEVFHILREVYYKEVFSKFQSQNAVDPWQKTKDLEDIYKIFIW